MKANEILEDFEVYKQQLFDNQNQGLNDIKADDVRKSLLSVLK